MSRNAIRVTSLTVIAAAIGIAMAIGSTRKRTPMANPIQVLGVYRLPVTPKLVSAQADELYGPASKLSAVQRREAEREAREQLESVALIECLVLNPDETFDVGDFTQPQPGVDRSSWQAAYEEAFLSADGEERLDVQWGDLPKENVFRVAFYLHFWNQYAPLVTSYGELTCPAVSDMPERLQRLAPFLPVD
jgi:hypothetical protein